MGFILGFEDVLIPCTVLVVRQISATTVAAIRALGLVFGAFFRGMGASEFYAMGKKVAVVGAIAMTLALIALRNARFDVGSNQNIVSIYISGFWVLGVRAFVYSVSLSMSNYEN